MAGRRRTPSGITTTTRGRVARYGSQGATHELGRERVTEIQRARLLAAMIEVCTDYGAANVTVAHVVERAGVSRRTFYEIYRDREECFLEAFDEGVARASRYVLDGYDETARWVDRMRGALTALLTFLDAERTTGRLLIVESFAAGDSALSRRRDVLEEIIVFVDRANAESGSGKQLPALTAECLVGGIFSILHSRLLRAGSGSFVELTGALASMIVLPYLGPAAARKELSRPVPKAPVKARRVERDTLSQLDMRLTYRTVRVLLAVAAQPGESNRRVAERAGVDDQGQISKLLARLEKLGLVFNKSIGPGTGAPNAWVLTKQGEEVHVTLAARA
ncbi:MAG TPA: TetR family transcriptional regulator [Solirubrobacteraceae bacterium]|jgi:AcrR family transcriptional regulator/DNA-binding MarR family transcriptional regulator|nr:TetR family transcriptional regulator [Solirubrobacteraceae bacterium]